MTTIDLTTKSTEPPNIPYSTYTTSKTSAVLVQVRNRDRLVGIALFYCGIRYDFEVVGIDLWIWCFRWKFGVMSMCDMETRVSCRRTCVVSSVDKTCEECIIG